MRVVLTLDQVAHALGVPVGTLRYWRQTGVGPPMFRLGRRVYAYEDDVETWVARQAAQQSSQPPIQIKKAPRAAATAPGGSDKTIPTKAFMEGQQS